MEKEANEDGVYSGSIVAAWRTVKASNDYYSRVRDYLLVSGCIEIQARSVPSIVRLYHPPEPFDEKDLTTGRESATLSAAQVTERLARVEARIGGMPIQKILLDFEQRIAVLEREREVEIHGKTT